MLKTGAGTAAVGGPRMLIPSCPPAPAFANMSLEQREAILQYWSTSPIPLLRKVQTLFSGKRRNECLEGAPQFSGRMSAAISLAHVGC